MSVRLDIIPQRLPSGFNLLDTIKLEHVDYGKYHLLNKAAKKLPKSLTVYDDNNIQGLRVPSPICLTDPYSRPLYWIKAGKFVEIYTIEHPTVWDKAVLAFVSALPKDHKLVLYYN